MVLSLRHSFLTGNVELLLLATPPGLIASEPLELPMPKTYEFLSPRRVPKVLIHLACQVSPFLLPCSWLPTGFKYLWALFGLPIACLLSPSTEVTYVLINGWAVCWPLHPLKGVMPLTP